MRSAVTAMAVAVLTLSACGGVGDAGSTPGRTATSSARPATTSAPPGWRWESYGDAEIAVPGAWITDATSPVLGAWCIALPRTPGQVSRPGVTPAVGCTGEDPASVGRTGNFVAFVDSGDTRPHGDRGDRVYVSPGRTVIAVQAGEPLRSRIAATARRITTVDAHGCAPGHPISADRTWRPMTPTVGELRDATGISACRYALPEFGRDGAGLISSTTIDGPTARRLLAAIAAAPTGGGPDQPGDCLPEASWGDEAIVALVHHARGPDTTIVMRYASCDHNGIDDGAVVHRLTGDDAPLTAGANRPNYWAGTGKGAALSHPER